MKDKRKNFNTLLGLVIFIAERRRKEIRIRKVLGASVAILIQLLSCGFLLLIVLVAGIGLPLGSYLIDGWLEAFSYGLHVEGCHLFLAVSLPLIHCSGHHQRYWLPCV